MGSLGDGVPRKYFNVSTDHSQSLKSNLHTTEYCLLHLSPFSLEKKKHTREPRPAVTRSCSSTLRGWVQNVRLRCLPPGLLCQSSGSRASASNLCLDPEGAQSHGGLPVQCLSVAFQHCAAHLDLTRQVTGTARVVCELGEGSRFKRR